MERTDIEKRKSFVSLVMNKKYPNIIYELFETETESGKYYLTMMINNIIMGVENGKRVYYIVEGDNRTKIESNYHSKLSNTFLRFGNEKVLITLNPKTKI
jgi:hypothetical protein